MMWAVGLVRCYRVPAKTEILFAGLPFRPTAHAGAKCLKADDLALGHADAGTGPIVGVVPEWHDAVEPVVAAGQLDNHEDPILGDTGSLGHGRTWTALAQGDSGPMQKRGNGRGR